MKKETNLMQSFKTDKGVLKILDVFQICVWGKTKNVNVYIATLCILFLWSPIQNHTLKGVFNEKYGYLKDLALSGDYNNTTGKSIDLLVGEGFYFNFETGKIRWRPPLCPVTVDSILRWILRAPTRTHKTKLQENVNFISSVIMCIETKTIERNRMKMWETRKQNLLPQKYVILLPFKPHHQFLSDNYSIAIYWLYSLKKQLDNPDLKTGHDDIFKN